jgi:16S rRNA G966 N2-methylase RsmD
LKENTIDDSTKFYDLCCGSGAVSLELINRGINSNNIVMIDNGCYGAFWQSIANDEFELNIFKNEINKLPNKEDIQQYLNNLSNQKVDKELMIYHYLLLQSGAFGSKQIWIEDDKWKNNTFRSYWLPTETSNRKSPVNPMMPMPDTLYERVETIVNQLGGCIVASQESVFDALYRLDEEWESGNKNLIVYCDPPYMNTTGYKEGFDIYELERRIWNNVPIYISEGFQMDGASDTYLLSEGRTKGNISGNVNKKPVQEWLNKFTYNI